MESQRNKDGLKDIPGVHDPIEDPFERERRRLYADPVATFPVFNFKSKYNIYPLMSSFVYYSFEYPIDLVHRFFESIRSIKPRRYYHQKFNRVPNIWECGVDDTICVYEAESQFRRDMKVDQEILDLIDHRLEVCLHREGGNSRIKCKELMELNEQVKTSWQIKYGDIGYRCDARRVLQKQKNRFIEDRYLARINSKKQNE